nr:choice-of-anchor J domain-containing protein [uncultured Fluviicola sp.]
MLKRIVLFSSVILSALSATAQTTLLDEDFQQGIPANWTIIKNDTCTAVDPQFAPAWIAYADPDNTADTVAAATSYFTSSQTASRWLITPPITIGTFGNYLKWKAKSYDPSYPDTYQVMLSTTDTQISSFDSLLLRVEFEWEDWTEHEINLSEYGFNNNETVHIAFVIQTQGGFNLFVDSINVRKDDPLSVNEQFLHTDVSIYPNPANDVIRFSTASLEQVSIYNTAGTLVYSQKNATPISISSFEQGIYLVRMTTNSGQTITKRVQKI